MTPGVYRLANGLYEHCYPLYFPLYSAWKALSDRHERALLRQLIRPGMTVLDIGANIGIYTRFFSNLVADKGQVHAFEPDRRNFGRLEANLRGVTNATLNNAAVGSASGMVKLYLSQELNVDHRTFDSGDGRAGVDVKLVALDDYIAANGAVDVVKIDVQGFELSVLEGARRILTENRGIAVLMEFWPHGLRKAGQDPSSLLAFMRSLGFSVRQVQGTEQRDLDAMAAGPGDVNDYCNLIMTRP